MDSYWEAKPAAEDKEAAATEAVAPVEAAAAEVVE